MKTVAFVVLFWGIAPFLALGYLDAEEEKLPTKCHVCKHMAREMSEELGRSAKSHDVLYLGQPFQKEPKKIDYRRSELRLTEALEDACTNVLDYKVHKDKPLALRYEKMESTTFKTLKGLKKRGVKVDLGFPDQMWDTPDAEVTRLKNRCEYLVEEYEDDITAWYWHHPEENLTQWLCVERVLDLEETDCLNENTSASKDNTEDESTHKNKEETKSKVKPTKKENTRKTEDKTEEEKDAQKTKQKKKVKGKKKDKNKKNKRKQKKKKKSADPRREENDSEKIQRLIRQQSEQQAKGGFENHSPQNSMDNMKRESIQMRLEEIRDTKTLRREIRKIRKHELEEEDYVPKAPWEDGLDSNYPAEVIRHMRRHVYERIENADDFRQEVEMRRMLSKKEDVGIRDEGFVMRALVREYVDEADMVRNPKELRERLQDLDALSAIFPKAQRRHEEL